MSASLGQNPADLTAAVNPFYQRIVTEAWLKAPADVAEINARAFERCIAAIEQTRRTSTSSAVILHGETGSGKTHVLSRLREALGSAPPEQEAIFVYVMLAPGASRLRRLVREWFVNSLLRPWRDQPSRLAGILRRLTKDRSWEHAAADHSLGHGLATVLGYVLDGKFPTATLSWLRGESLAGSVLEKMELNDGDDWDDADEERRSFEVIAALCRLADPLPVVFCCDQAEALRASVDDRQGFFAYGQMAAAIRNQIPNAVLISSIQTVLLSDLEKGMHEADYQRLGDPIGLQLIDRAQGRLLLEKRLEAEPIVARARSAQRRPELWPIDEQKLEPVYDAGGRTAARRLLYRAAELFEEARSRQLPDEGTLDAYLEKKLSELQRESRAWQSPSHTDAILEHGLPVLAGLARKRIDSVVRGPVSFRIGGEVGPAISLCSQQNQAAFSKRLGRLAQSGQRGLILVRDLRLEVRQTPKAAEYTNQLAQSGARWLRPSAEAVAALDALRQLHDGYGTLSHRGESIGPATVADWLRQNLPPEVAQLADELFEPASQFPGERLMERLSEEFVLDVKAAADWLRIPAEDVVAYAQRRSNQVLLVTGPNPVLCVVAGAAPEDADNAD